MSDDRRNGPHYGRPGPGDPHYGEGGDETRDLDDPRAAERRAEERAQASGGRARGARRGDSAGMASAG